MEDGGVVKKSGTDMTSAVTSLITDLLSTTLDQKKAALISDVDSRENPANVLKRANSLDSGKAVISGAGKGASIGTMIAPGIGTAIGAGLGALTSGIGRLVGANDRKEALDEASKDWSDSWSKKTGASIQQYGYKKGGKVKGEGTGTSDSIDMDAEDGSFIVPADNSEYAMELGREYLGWNDGERASKKDGDVDIKVSNGEVMFTPKEVSILKYHGVDVDALAPEGKPESRMKKEGNSVDKDKMDDYRYRQGNPLIDDLKLGTSPLSLGIDNNMADYRYRQGNPLISDITTPPTLKSGLTIPEFGSMLSQNQFDSSKFTGQANNPSAVEKPVEEEKSKFSKVMDMAPEILGALQAAGGAYGLLAAGRKPDMQVSKTLKKLSSEVRKLSEFGYEPAVLNALNAEIENTRRNISRSYTDSGNVSGLERMAGLNTLLSTTIDKKAGLAFADAAEKSRKYADVLRIDTMKAGQEFDINKMNVEDWYRNQEVFASMAAAGVSNIIGARQLKAEQDAIKKTGNNKPTYIPVTANKG